LYAVVTRVPREYRLWARLVLKGPGIRQQG